MFRRWLAAIIVSLLGCGVAIGHPMPNSVVALDIGEKTVSADVTIPLIELDLALGTNLSDEPATAVPAAEEQLKTYIGDHISAATKEGASWSYVVEDVALAALDDVSFPEIVAQVRFTPPAGSSVRDFVLTYDAVMHKVVTHYALVTIGSDWQNGVVSGEHGQPVSVGTIRVNPVDGNIAPLSIDLSAGSYWQGFAAMFALGMTHIAEGTDHLLFLLTLLLPAPLLAIGGRWEKQAGLRPTIAGLLKIVTAFTIGHSVTLIIATLFRLDLPEQPIEVLIACTILISALHALRPIFPGREAFVAATFGLIHGLAFSFTLAELNLSTWQLALSLLGFNLGIEVFQLAIVALALPALLLFLRNGYYAWIRRGGAVAAAIASAGWISDRLGYSSAFATIVDAIGPFLPAGLLALTTAGLLLLPFRVKKNTITANR
jgi:hypothetical protein